MSKFILIAALAIPGIASYGQSEIHYHDKDGAEVAKENCYSYTLEKKKYHKTDSIVSYYCNSNSLKAVTHVDDDGRWKGDYRTYYENGNMKVRGYYDDYTPVDSFYSYYPDGSLHYMEFRGTTEIRDKRIVYYRDSLGNVLVNDGMGFCKCRWFNDFSISKFVEAGLVKNGKKDSLWITYDMNGVKQHEDLYDKGEFISGVSWDENGREIKYKEIGMTASPSDGMHSFYSFIGQNIRYPPDARKKRIQGKVFVEFVVEKDGSVSGVEAIRGIGVSCDREAERVVRLSPTWTPAYQYGKPVRQKMVLPINFRL